MRNWKWFWLEELDEKKARKYKIIRTIIQIILIAVVLGAIIWATIYFFPIFVKIQNDEGYRNTIISKINEFPWILRFLIIIGAQIFQVILTIIPSGPIVIVAGVLFDPFIAMLTCLIGQTIGGLIVYYLVKLLGVRFLALFVDPNKVKNSKLLGNTTRCEVLMFGYLLIPALPKDIVSFIAPFTKIKVWKFCLIQFVARIPMTIVTVLMGSSLISGEYWLVIMLACLSGLLALLCFIFNSKIVNFLEKRQAKSRDLDDNKEEIINENLNNENDVITSNEETEEKTSKNEDEWGKIVLILLLLFYNLVIWVMEV